MVQVVCHGEQLVANGLTYQKHLVFGGVDASGEHGTVGLELVQVFQFGLDKPGCGVVPLEMMSKSHSSTSTECRPAM